MILPILVATRNAGKLREIEAIASEYPAVRLQALPTSLPFSQREEQLECFGTFRENALAKARYFAEHAAGRYVLAEDSGLCVEALGGAPGIRSKRFSGRHDLSGSELDHANNALLLERIADVPANHRGAHFVCAAALIAPDGSEAVFEASCAGEILPAPRGVGGFGYDPLFWIPDERGTFAELTPERKDRISHRGQALRQALGYAIFRA